MKDKVKVEMHCHTYFSEDGFNNQNKLFEICRKRRIDVVCVTDHDIIRGALDFLAMKNPRIVVGQEMSTGEGHIIGLFLKEEIAAGLGAEATIEKIKTQGGLVYLPHPFDEFRKSAVKLKVAERVKDMIDIIEVFNSRTFNSKYNTMALEFAKEYNIPIAVGSDAHHWFEVGNSYMTMDDFNSSETFLESLKNADYVKRRCPFFLRLYLKGLKILTGKH